MIIIRIKFENIASRDSMLSILSKVPIMFTLFSIWKAGYSYSDVRSIPKTQIVVITILNKSMHEIIYVIRFIFEEYFLILFFDIIVRKNNFAILNAIKKLEQKNIFKMLFSKIGLIPFMSIFPVRPVNIMMLNSMFM